MEASHCSSLWIQENNFVFDCESLLDKSHGPDSVSDSGYFSAGSSLSPTSSVDSFCFSPSCLRTIGIEHAPLDDFVFKDFTVPSSASPAQSPLRLESSSASTLVTKISRSRHPSKKRQNASNREKLRMRDLTKSLNHLRTYLPPSVAPLGQSLTKIETLRLTIRYISYLSGLLGLKEEALQRRRSTGLMEQTQALTPFLRQPSPSDRPQQVDGTTSCTEQLPALHHLYQVSGGVCFSSEQHWMQNIHNVAFPGQSRDTRMPIEPL